MKIIVDYREQDSDMQNLRIDSAKHLSDYVIRISFNDGSEKLVDFKPFLLKSLHPSVKIYLDESKFSKFNLANGNLNWNDYDLIFPVWDLYQGKIEA